MKLPHSIIRLLHLLVLFSSCHKNSIPQKSASDYFPNSVGNYWKYEVYDSTALKKFDVTVRITGIQKLIDGNNAFLWEYQYPWATDTNYVRIVGDTVKVYDRFRIESLRGLQFPLKIFLIPFKDTQKWDGMLMPIDTFHVMSQSAIATSSENFSNGFNIYHYYKGPNIEYNDTYYFVPHVGMVKIYYNHYDLAPPTSILWQLKSYLLK